MFGAWQGGGGTGRRGHYKTANEGGFIAMGTDHGEGGEQLGAAGEGAQKSRYIT